MKKDDKSDPFWITEDGRAVYRGVPVAISGKEVGLHLRLKLLENVKLGKTILSVGCGLATDLNALGRANCTTLGIDPERKFLDKGKKKNNADNLIQGIGEQLPLADNSIDLVLLFEVLEHVINPEETIRELHRVLKPSGCLFVTVPNKFYFVETHGAKICNTTIFLAGVGVPFFSMCPTFIRKKFEKARIFDQAAIMLLLRSNRFDPFRMEYLMPPLDILKQTSLTLSLGKCLFRLSKIPVVKMFGANIMVLSRKRG